MQARSRRLRLGGQARGRRSPAEGEQLRDPPPGSSHEITTPVEDLATRLSGLLSELESLKAQIGSEQVAPEAGGPEDWREVPAGAQAPKEMGPTIGEPEQLDALGTGEADEDLRARADELRQATAAVATAVDRLTAALDAVKKARPA